MNSGVSHFGLRNIFTTIDDTYIKVTSLVRQDTTADRFPKRRDGN